MLNILKKYFGYTKFKSAQQEIITSIIDGKDTLAVLPTGAGKSLCYQIPAILGDSFSIVISPLIALMKDQVDALNKNEILSAFINSTLDYLTTEKVLYNIGIGKIKLLYISPEKLSNSLFVERISKLKPQYLFIDEAHCISQWGHNFRPSYRRIREFAEFINISNISAFTATATPVVKKDIIEQLGMNNPNIFTLGFERDNLFLNVLHTKHKKEKTLKLIRENHHPALIYTSTRKNAEELNDYINLNGIEANYYHAGLSSAQREIIQDDFISGRLNIIIATNAFGMGIDKDNIRTIIHYNCTGTIENYYQEIGRAGRDGNISNIYLLYELKDKIIQEYFIKNNFPSKYELEIIYNAICNYGQIALGTKPHEDIILEKQFFSNLIKSGINDLKFQSAFNFLESSGYFEQIAKYKREYFFRFIFNDSELKNYVSTLKNKELKNFIVAILQKYRSLSFIEQVSINLEQLAKHTTLSKNEVLANFETLKNLGIITFKKPSMQPSVKMLKERVPFTELNLNTDNLHNVLTNSFRKLEQMVEYTYTEKCRFNYILNYFGERRKDYECGHCDNCRKHSGSTMNFNEFIEDKILQTIHEAKFIIRKPVLIKILLGIDKTGSLNSLSTYGSCEQHKKSEIDSSADSLFSKGLIKVRNNSLYLSEKGKLYFIETEQVENSTNKEMSSTEADNTLELFNKLRESRRWLSKKFSQPIQYICSDEILRNIARAKPKNSAELSTVKGVNKRMLNKISDEFIFEITEFEKRKSTSIKKNISVPNNLTDIQSLINKNYKLEDIAKLTKLPESVVYLQIETLKSYDSKINLNNLVTKTEMEMIYEKAKSFNWDNLKELKEILPHNISYAKLKVVLLQNDIKF